MIDRWEVKRLESAIRKEESLPSTNRLEKREREGENPEDGDFNSASQKIRVVDDVRNLSIKQLHQQASLRGVSTTGSKKELLEKLCKDTQIKIEDIVEDQNESIVMVLLNTVVAVCGSFELGSYVGYTAPTQSTIVFYLNLLVAEGADPHSLTTEVELIGSAESKAKAEHIAKYVLVEIHVLMNADLGQKPMLNTALSVPSSYGY
ncbi:hypothetical protein L6452_02789 [Arctium lappa]|uniref:Uncharacterized protein n=1 Tax=Arctium lappa TaxID=4217 RepID=A0ACB9FJT9_ARCLA|nr:hypothetical protein L6452_02789 [Arctium lappa]